MKNRYIFTKDAVISETGFAQSAPQGHTKTFKKGTVVWGEVYPNSVRLNDDETTTQGYALSVDDANDANRQWDVPLPPFGDSPVVPAPIFTFKNIAISGGIVLGVYVILKLTKVI